MLQVIPGLNILRTGSIIATLAVAVMLLLPVNVDGVSRFAIEAQVTDTAGRPLEGVAVSFHDLTPGDPRDPVRPLGQTGPNGRLSTDVRHRWSYPLPEWRLLTGHRRAPRYELRFEHPRGTRAVPLEEETLRREQGVYVVDVWVAM